MSTVHFKGVWKLFGDVVAVRELNLTAEDGEFLVLVGASGCGKTTTMRMLAGLDTPTYGSIWIDGEDVTLAPPGDRDVAMVFQSYALYPHMTVRKNLAFGPKVRRVSRADIRRNVDEVAAVLGLDSLLDRKPSELSGGQRQRVALGRVMIRHPRLSLLDEPLSNLDAALRVQMRAELVRLQKTLKVTTVYVTHDQIEAMTMGDRIAVLDQGVLLQIGTPAEIYDHPATLYVATFIGSPRMSILRGELHQDAATQLVRCIGTEIPVADTIGGFAVGSRVRPFCVGIRPHDLFVADEAPSRCTVSFRARVDVVEPTGAEAFVRAAVADEVVTIRVTRAADVRTGEDIEVRLDPRDLHVFDAESGHRIPQAAETRRPSQDELDGSDSVFERHHARR